MTAAQGALPRIAHVPMAFCTPDSTLLTVTRRLAAAHGALGGDSVAVLSARRGLELPEVRTVYADYSERCPREWFTRAEFAVDVASGALGRLRPYYGRLYEPAIRTTLSQRPDLVLLYEGHYASATLPEWSRALRGGAEVCLYVHNPLSRTYGRRELRRLLGAADRVVFCADHLRADVEERTGTLATPMETVHNGVEPELFADAPRRAPDGELVVLYVGRVAPHKGVHLVIEAAQRAAAVLNRPVRVRVVGAGAYAAGSPLAEYEAQLREAAAAGQVPVDLVPFLDRAGLARELRRASLACLPSTWAEGLPLAALECMAAALPVVCSTSAGMVEACGEAALLAPMGDVAALADAMAALGSDDAEWERRSALSLDRARRFTWERAARRFARVAEPDVTPAP